MKIGLKTHPLMGVDQLGDAFEKDTTFAKKKVVMLSADRVPIPVIRPPTFSIRLMHMPLAGKDLIWLKAQFEPAQSVKGAVQGAPGIDSPEGAVPDCGCKFLGEMGDAAVGIQGIRQCTIKVRAQ